MQLSKFLISALFVGAVLAASSAIDPVAAVAQDDIVLEAEWRMINNAEARGHMAKGDELLGSSSYGAARREYEMAAELIRADGEFPALAVHRQARSFYHEGMNQMAISRLDDLADEAATFGDLVTQVWALADQAWIQGQAGFKIDMDRTVVRLERLLTSPYLPDDVVKEVMSKRLGEGTTISSPGGM